LIPKETVDKVIEISKIEDVVGDYVSLKKRGVNMLGLCPFHSERTPSFTVSPAKGIYKCFGCGKGGNSVQFIMDHESLSFVDSIKYLAKKFNIEVKEEEQSAEQIERNNDRESIFSVLLFAQKTFSEQLINSEQGKAIGLSYFYERGFTDAIIEKFQLGYSLESSQAFISEARKNGFADEFSVKSGMVIEKEGRFFDRFASRVMFPIHNISGRVVGFGGRTLSKEKNVAKYLNSPETEVYHKSNILYGFYQAKKDIIAQDNCFLVEGYTDVISLHLSGITNVVASSGTSLTVEQIRLIRRFSKNITILYDGDAAGIKASFRGIDLVLEEGMNVKVLLFPDGEDPDSFSKKNSSADLKEFILKNTVDFIRFKTQLLLEGVSNDPIKKAGLIKEMVDSIALIPDSIIRSMYIQECSRLMKIEEQTLLFELNKQLRGKRDKAALNNSETTNVKDIGETVENKLEDEEKIVSSPFSETEHQEKDLIRILLNYGDKVIHLPVQDSSEEQAFTLGAVLIHEIAIDNISFFNSNYNKIFTEYQHLIGQNISVNQQYFLSHQDSDIQKTAVDLVSEPYTLSKHWEEKHNIFVQSEEDLLKQTYLSAVTSLKIKFVISMIKQLQEKLKELEDPDELNEMMKTIIELNDTKGKLSQFQGRVILK
jgi:DNA primase